MDATALLGRAAMSVIFILAGLMKAVGWTGTVGLMAALKMPVPEAAAAVTVLIELGGGLLLLIGFQVRIAAVVLAVWCLATAAVAHSDLADHEQMINAVKNLAIFGGLLQVAAFGGGRFSFGRRRGGRLG
jgi:putative oxidoreductase